MCFWLLKKTNPIRYRNATIAQKNRMPALWANNPCTLYHRVGYKNCCFVHVALVPEMGSPGEQKTKPTQHSVKQMRALGEYTVCAPYSTPGMCCYSPIWMEMQGSLGIRIDIPMVPAFTPRMLYGSGSCPLVPGDV